MAVTRTSRNTINTFARYDNTAVGQVTANAFVLQPSSSTTRYVSTDGITWTAYAITSAPWSPSGVLYSTTLGGWVIFQNGNGGVYYPSTATQTSKMKFEANNWFASPNFASGYLDTGKQFLFGTGGMTRVYQWPSGYVYAYDSAPYGDRILSPAWDGNTTWAVASVVNTGYFWSYYSTGSANPGDGLMPVNIGNTGYLGYTSYSSYTTPNLGASAYRQLTFYKGFWYLSQVNGNVYQTANIATASPSWTNIVNTGLNSCFFVLNDELWMLPQQTAGSTAYKTTSGGASWTTVTLPASKNASWAAYGNGVYIIANTDGTVYRSTTGASGSFTQYSTGATSVTSAFPTIAFGPA